MGVARVEAFLWGFGGERGRGGGKLEGVGEDEGFPRL